MASRPPPPTEGALYGALKGAAFRMAPTGLFRFGATWDAVRRSGFETTRATWLRGVRAMGQVFTSARRVPLLPDSAVPTGREIAESPLTHRQQFAWTVRIRGASALTGRVESALATIYTDRPTTIGDIKRIARSPEFLDPSPLLPDPEEVEVVLVESSASHRTAGLLAQAGAYGWPIEEEF